MKLVTFGPEFTPGLLAGDRVVDLSPVVDSRDSPQERVAAILANFASLRPDLERLLAIGNGKLRSEVRLRSPLPRPGKVLCCIGNYREGTDRPIQDIDMFLKSPDSVCGDGDTVVLPSIAATVFHHEAELAVVIGRTAKNVSLAEANEVIFGYTGFMDVSARGTGRAGANSFIGKSPDTFGPTGPCIVSRDEIADPHCLQVQYWVDGQLRHNYQTSDMEHSIPEVIAWITRFVTLNPGDLIALGTNHQGVGPLQDGETGVMEIEAIGRLTIQVSDPEQRRWAKGVDEEMARQVRGG